VAIAPRGYAARDAQGLGVVGVAFDGTAEAELALALGQRLAAGAGATLRVIAVVPKVVVRPSRIGHTARGYQRVLDAHFEAALEGAGARLPSTVSYELVRLEGPPPVILAEATQRLDLIVTGSRGYGPVRRALLGGTASALVRTAHCPVVVTPRP
jgi:nucleotide-binding universal stress UspA family protein